MTYSDLNSWTRKNFPTLYQHYSMEIGEKIREVWWYSEAEAKNEIQKFLIELQRKEVQP